MRMGSEDLQGGRHGRPRHVEGRYSDTHGAQADGSFEIAKNKTWVDPGLHIVFVSRVARCCALFAH